MCFLKTVPSATCVLWDRKILFLFMERVYTEGTVFMKPAVCPPFSTILPKFYHLVKCQKARGDTQAGRERVEQVLYPSALWGKLTKGGA